MFSMLAARLIWAFLHANKYDTLLADLKGRLSFVSHNRSYRCTCAVCDYN